tara:strand:+ start:1591 stop:1800 length:210 start_codon:yes stop_codon:yes gene_type:complete
MDYLSVEHEYIIEQEKNIDKFGNLAGGSIPFPPFRTQKNLRNFKVNFLNKDIYTNKLSDLDLVIIYKYK